MIFLYFPGLIIGAVITYSSPANEITSENVTLPINSTFNAFNYPNALKLFIPVVNHSEPKIYQYSHPEEQSQAQQQEKILEEKVFVIKNCYWAIAQLNLLVRLVADY